jgi:hypothetical protein
LFNVVGGYAKPRRRVVKPADFQIFNEHRTATRAGVRQKDITVLLFTNLSIASPAFTGEESIN